MLFCQGAHVQTFVSSVKGERTDLKYHCRNSKRWALKLWSYYDKALVVYVIHCLHMMAVNKKTERANYCPSICMWKYHKTQNVAYCRLAFCPFELFSTYRCQVLCFSYFYLDFCHVWRAHPHTSSLSNSHIHSQNKASPSVWIRSSD